MNAHCLRSPSMLSSRSAAVYADESRHFELCHVGQNALDDFAFLKAERGLRRPRLADRVALDLQAGLDAGGQIEAREGLVDAPQLALQRHRLRPFPGAAQRSEEHT